MSSDWMSAWERALRMVGGAWTGAANAQQASLEAATRYLELWAGVYGRLWGQAPPSAPEGRAGPRFQDDAWRENVVFDALKQAYLINAQWLTDLTDGLVEVDPKLHERARFWVRQLADAVSPANSPLTNPAVIQETIRTGGTNLARGMRNWLADVQRGRVTMVPDDAFQVGKDLAATPGKVVYRNQLIELIQYTPTTEQVRAVPILAVPPWVNKYYVMDMRPQNSMFRYLVDAGHTVFTISWKNPAPGDPALKLEWEDYIALGPLAALRVVKAITGSERVNLVGYCLGGVLLQVTLAYLAGTDDATPNSATFFATHQDFEQAGDISVFISEPEVQVLEWLMDTSGGYLDGRNMAATFNLLRANDLFWPYIVNNYLLGQDPAAFDLLYWNADGTRLPKRVHSYLLRNFFLENRLAQPGGLQVKGVPIDTHRITVPAYTVAGTTDHIVPWRGAFKMHEMTGGPLRFVLAESGHIAGIINPPAQNKRSYWTNDMASTDADAWLAAATQHPGSWWGDWLSWLEERSGPQIPPPTVGSTDFPPLEDAPGTYVLEK